MSALFHNYVFVSLYVLYQGLDTFQFTFNFRLLLSITQNGDKCTFNVCSKHVFFIVHAFVFLSVCLSVCMSGFASSLGYWFFIFCLSDFARNFQCRRVEKKQHKKVDSNIKTLCYCCRLFISFPPVWCLSIRYRFLTPIFSTVLAFIKLTKFAVALRLRCGSCKLIFWHYFIMFKIC